MKAWIGLDFDNRHYKDISHHGANFFRLYKTYRDAIKDYEPGFLEEVELKTFRSKTRKGRG